MYPRLRFIGLFELGPYWALVRVYAKSFIEGLGLVSTGDPNQFSPKLKGARLVFQKVAEPYQLC